MNYVSKLNGKLINKLNDCYADLTIEQVWIELKLPTVGFYGFYGCKNVH